MWGISLWEAATVALVVFGLAIYVGLRRDGARTVEADEGDTAEEADAEPRGSVGDYLRAAVAGAAIVPLAVMSPLVSAFPPAWRIYHKIHRWSAWQMQKASRADTLANVRRSNGMEDVLPAKWSEGKEDEKDRTGWKVKGLGDKRYDPAVHGQSTSRMGKANFIHIAEDAPEQGAWAEVAMDNALQLDREQYLFSDAQVNMVVVEGGGDDPQQALADGGQAQYVHSVSVDNPGVLVDALVPIGARDGYDGQVVSWNRYQTLKTERGDQETIRDAKNSAWAAAKLDSIEGKDLIKWAIILGIAGFVLLFHAEIGAFIGGIAGGGGGGGGGGGLPISVGWLAPLARRR
jgi:hypothetical protein